MTDPWGIDHRYLDATGIERQIAPETIEHVRQIIGEPGDEAGPVVLRVGQSIDLGRGELLLEDGSRRLVEGPVSDLPLGYHRFIGEAAAPRMVIVAPESCTAASTPAWGWAAQLYATRSSNSWGIGDLGDLRNLAHWSRSLGAGFILINPIGAVFPVGQQQPSPYYPASRLYRSPLYLRIEDVPGVEGAADAVASAAAAGRTLNNDRLIDRDTVWSLKRAALEAIWAAGAGRDGFDEWFAGQPQSLQQFARWAALTEEHGASWYGWPDDCRHPSGPGAAAIASAKPERVRFHAWLQWLLERQLAAASADLMIMQDLPIGFNPAGFDGWAWQDMLASGVSVGAPPDEFNSRGQDWGLPPFIPSKLRAANYQPFIETVRAAMASGGGLRIDHVMGLFRLWWVPRDAGPAGGAYVRSRADELLAILALESHRAGAVVVGEDLGTVEEGVRDVLAAHNVLGYRLLWFEDHDPATWPANTMAAITTHDLPTVAGLWSGADLAQQEELGMSPNREGTGEMRDRLRTAGHVDNDASDGDAVLSAHRLLARAPSILVSATFDDAIVESERPNVPGADGSRPNWSLALPLPLDAIKNHSIANAIAAVLGARTVAADRPSAME